MVNDSGGCDGHHNLHGAGLKATFVCVDTQVMEPLKKLVKQISDEAVRIIQQAAEPVGFNLQGGKFSLAEVAQAAPTTNCISGCTIYTACSLHHNPETSELEEL